jgi:hypothetical protein
MVEMGHPGAGRRMLAGSRVVKGASGGGGYRTPNCKPSFRNSTGLEKSSVISWGYGGPGGARTHDPKIKSLVLYQLSYRPAQRP